ncbi:tRNA (adenosine(37)-N6)-threonylcarbamoyltransferase complex ATPase subunit type 1 TsaE [bacterium]|nr:tRNA (adenosine(37)-N6)-threonylcarbamoyltransferase complex ATPase subunit type 1 TsaE [bacterium]
MNIEEIIQCYLSRDLKELKGKVIGLVGSLGVGKTHFVRTFLEKISKEFKDHVNSPTYNLCHIYKSSLLEVHHFDLYRIESEEDLYDIGILDSLEGGGLLVFIEWVDLFPMLENRCDEIIHIDMDDNNIREYRIHSKATS